MEASPKKYLLLTYPRVASNMLMQVLALDEQPQLLANHQRSYHQRPAYELRIQGPKLSMRAPSSWSAEERTQLKSDFQASHDKIQEQVTEAAAKEKNVFLKEHAPWTIEPAAEHAWAFKQADPTEESWMVVSNLGSTRSPLNNTIYPDEELRTWLPTFLIRHPAIAFPSIYRAAVDVFDQEMVKSEPFMRLGMALHWSRHLYDWYASDAEFQSATASEQTTWPVVLDADDVIEDEGILLEYGKAVGFDPENLHFSWSSKTKEELAQFPPRVQRFGSTIFASSAIDKGKLCRNVDVDEEVSKWKEEFGDEVTRKIEQLVREMMPHYEHLRSKRFGADRATV